MKFGLTSYCFFTNIIVYLNRSKKSFVKKKITLPIFVVCAIIVLCVCVCVCVCVYVCVCVFAGMGIEKPLLYIQLWDYKIKKN